MGPAPVVRDPSEVREGEQDSPELKKCLLSTIAGWKTTLEKKFLDSDKVIDEKCGKSAEIEFQNKEAVTANSNATAEAQVQWTRSNKTQRDTRKQMMAQLLAPSAS